MRTVFGPAARLGAPRSKRLLALAGDERLVERIRRGDGLAFEVAYERHAPAILSFCRHMLGSREEAEDAVQHAFISAFGDLQRDERAINLKPWLYAIARNRCLSMLRARRHHASGEHEIATAGLAEQVERRGELRDLLRDVEDLPAQQRGALLMSELSGLTHAEIGSVLGCEPHKVKALVFRARSGLMERREAREAPCREIREELANLRGGSLRRGRLRHHLRVCEGCREYREQVRRQRGMLAAVLPVAPSLGLKQSVLGAIGLGGGSAGGGGLLGGLGAAATSQAGGATLAKFAIVGVLAGGGVVAGNAVVEHSGAGPGTERSGVEPAVAAPESAAPVPVGGRPEAGATRRDDAAPAASSDGKERKAEGRKHRGRGHKRHEAKSGKGEAGGRAGRGANDHGGKGKERGHRRAVAVKQAKGRGKARARPEWAGGPKAVRERPEPREPAPKADRTLRGTARSRAEAPVELRKLTKDERAAAKAD